MSDIKQIIITGNAATESVERRRTRKREGGIQYKNQNSEQTTLPVFQSVMQSAAVQPVADIPQKIVLGPKKNKVKVLLTRKRIHVAGAEGPRPARKVTLGLIGHKRRITRARRLRKESRALPISDIEEHLIQKGIIKSTSKAPDTILRQMYEDAMSLTQPTL